MGLDQQAVELNEAIRSANPQVFNLLSERGKTIFFPKKGILSQSADAKGSKINATIGTALEDNGSPMILDSIKVLLNLKNAESFGYAPSPGRPEIRNYWKEMLPKKNPALAGKTFSLPVVSCALTHGLSMAGYLFINEGDEIISPDLYWENYDLVFTNAYGGKIRTFPTFVNNSEFNIEGLKASLNNSSSKKKIVILNFPNNPTGYTITESEAAQIKNVLVECANQGNSIAVLIDDAYFGLVYEKGILLESIFSSLADAHENILAIKFDGPTKEDYVWGFRVGFITFACKSSTPAMLGALEGKLAGAIRGNISNASNLSQTLLLEAFQSTSYTTEKNAKYEILRKRYEKILDILQKHPEYQEYFVALPFNSGYFMCVRLHNKNSEAVRKKLIEKYSTGVIAQGDVIRLAFSAVPFDMLEKLYDNLYQAACECRNV
jgi:aspartate/methionine/tyrosine aminotransferase